MVATATPSSPMDRLTAILNVAPGLEAALPDLRRCRDRRVIGERLRALGVNTVGQRLTVMAALLDDCAAPPATTDLGTLAALPDDCAAPPATADLSTLAALPDDCAAPPATSCAHASTADVSTPASLVSSSDVQTRAQQPTATLQALTAAVKQQPLPALAPAAAGVPFVWPAVYEIVHHPAVAIREAPSLSARTLGFERWGAVVFARADVVDGWAALWPRDSGYMLIDGAPAGFGELLRRVAAPWDGLLPQGEHATRTTAAASVPSTDPYAERYRVDRRLMRAVLPCVQLAAPRPMPLRLAAGCSPAHAHLAARMLLADGFAICASEIDLSVLRGAADEARRLYAARCMRPGETGAALQGETGAALLPAACAEGGGPPRVRGDSITWLREHLNGKVGQPGGNAAIRSTIEGVASLIALDKEVERFGEAVSEALLEVLCESGHAGHAGHAGHVSHGSAAAAAGGGGGSVARLDGWRDEHSDARAAEEGPSRARPLLYAGRSDLMVTCYPGDNDDGVRGYSPHLDNDAVSDTDAADRARPPLVDGKRPLGTSTRLLTMVTYLNASWDSGGGGELRLHVPSHAASAAGCTVPEGTTAVVDVVCARGREQAATRSLACRSPAPCAVDFHCGVPLLC